MEDYFKKKIPVTLKDGQIQQNKITKKLEILIKTYTNVEASSTH